MSALTYVLYFKLVGSVGPTKAISVEFVVTVIAVLVGAVFLKEQLSLIQFVGAAVIIGGCALVLSSRPALPKETEILPEQTSAIEARSGLKSDPL